MKRAESSLDGKVSPPSTRRKVESTTTSKAVTSFFKPASQKDPETITWRIVKASLVIGKYNHPTAANRNLESPVKVAAFDFDDTIITPTTGNRWARAATGWRWWDTSVPSRLKQLHDQGYLIVFLSNQNSISLKDDPKKLQKDKASLANFKTQVVSVLRQLDLPISVYAATALDHYRKPRVGMWEEMKEDYDLEAEGKVDLDKSFYVGDAAGREKTDTRRKDHACSDRDLASNIGIAFHTPEEFFLEASPEPYVPKFEPAQFLAQSAKEVSENMLFVKRNTQDVVLFCGSPGAGKSSFYWDTLQPLEYERVNQDILKTRDRCIKKAREYLEAGSSVAVDNTNRDPETRAHWTRLAQEFNVPIRCIYFTAPPRLCEHNDAVRALNKDFNPGNRVHLPSIAFIDFTRRFIEPSLTEGFQDITKVDFKAQMINDKHGQSTGFHAIQLEMVTNQPTGEASMRL